MKKPPKQINKDLSATEAILESISDGVFTVDHQWHITSFNRAGETITGIPKVEAIGRPCAEVFRSSMCETGCALRETLKTNKPIINRPCYIINADGHRIPISVSTAVLRDGQGEIIGGAETFRDLSEVEALRRELEGRYQAGDMVSRSPSMHKIFEILPSVAASTSTILIQGETGTGKELLARAVHGLSPRKDKPFIAVNCGALPDTLLESELFGYKKGAFTGADKDKPGRFTLAENGTLFLDEIGEISFALQVKLLRVLQDKTFEPLGSTQSIKADVRIITATNQDLTDLVKTGKFREDLFYRIHVVRLDLPPLRERKEDIPILVNHFINRFNHIQKKAVSGVSPEVMALLMAHRWPGNIRELENLIERAFILCSEGSISLEHLPEDMTGLLSVPKPTAQIGKTRRLAEAAAIREALQRHGGNRTAAAKELGVNKSTLYRKIKGLGLNLPGKDGRSRQKRKNVPKRQRAGN
ncbi:MAG: sigma 54-interacting transcriptional regulator [Deltaproteobacteria bacterium]|nr:sigma 54-interacting transcriptional regulator [Deltaproteobacteria bacterium]